MSQGPLSLVIQPMLGAIARLDSGAQAELRRGEPTDPAKVSLWRIIAGEAAVDQWLGRLEGAARDRDERNLAVLAWALATAGDRAALGAAQFGKALRQAQVSELRFVRLLRARPDQLPREVRGCVGQLRAAQVQWDPTGLALLLSDGDADKRESWRRDVARHYFAEDHRARKAAGGAP